MDTSRIQTHKEVNFMKKFNLSKGLIVGLLTFALSIVAFATVGASADEAAEATPTKSAAVAAEYNAADDTVTAGSNAYVYVVKAASGNKIKAGTAAAGQMEANKIKIADLGIKGTKKDVFLYVCDKEVEVEETVAANLTIKGNANKVVGAIDYTQADSADSLKVLSAYYVDKSTKKQVDIASEKLYWSADQETWYLANSNAVTTRKDSKGQATKDGFLGKDLAEMLEAGGLIYVKQVGTSGGSGTAQFGSAVAKVKIAKQAKAPKVKIDVAKDTIALKNGFDFAIVVKNETTKEYTDIYSWKTILPVLKTATISSEGDSIVGGMHGEKATAFKPLGKKDANAGKEVKNDGDTNYYYSYTKYAIKALSIDKLFEIVDLNPAVAGIQLPDDYKIAVRKSATEKKPASAYSTIDLALKTEAPIVWTESNVKGQFLVASADEFSKKGLTLGEIAPFAGYTGNKVIATTGFDASFKIAEATNDTKDRDEGSVFEYAVVATADYYATGDAAIDWTTLKWKKFDPAKLKITEKLSGKYSTVKGTKKTADLKGTASAAITGTEADAYGRTVNTEAAVKAGTKSLLLVRRQGDKSTGKRASEEIVLYVAKENKKYNLYSTVSNGVMADKYTVVFFKYDATKQGFYKDESIAAITGWSQKEKTGVKLEALTGAEYWKITSVADGKATLNTGNTGKYTAAADKITGSDTDEVAKGDYQILVNADNDDSFESETVNIAIREYANIKVNAVFGTVKDGNFTKVGDPMLVAEIKDGKAFTATITDGKINWTAPAANATVVKYVGDKADIEFAFGENKYKYPEHYAAATAEGFPKVVAGTGYGVTNTGYKAPTETENAKAAPEAGTAEEIEVEVQIPVQQMYTVKVKAGSANGAKITDNTYAIVNQSVTFKVSGVTVPDGKVLVVKNGDTPLTATQGVYTVAIPGGNGAGDVEISIVLEDAPQQQG
jgi:hypothetical protein